MKYFFLFIILVLLENPLTAQVSDSIFQVFDSTYQVLEQKTSIQYSKHAYNKAIKEKEKQIALIIKQEKGHFLDSLSIINNQDLAALRYLSGYIQGKEGKESLKHAKSAMVSAIELSQDEFERCKLVHNKSMIERALRDFQSAKKGFKSVITILDSLIIHSKNDSLISTYFETKVNTLNELGELYIKEYIHEDEKSKLDSAKIIFHQTLKLADNLITQNSDTLYPYFMKEIYHRLVKVYKYENNADSIRHFKEILLTNNYQELPNATLRDKIRLALMELMVFDGIREAIVFKEENKDLNFLLTISLFSIGLILLIFILVLIKNYNRLHNRKQELLNQNILLNDKNNELESLKEAFNQSHTGIAIVNEEGIIQYINKQSKSWHQLQEGTNYFKTIIKNVPEIESKMNNCFEETRETGKAQFGYDFNINATELLRLKVDFTKVKFKKEILYYITETDISKTYLLLNNLQELTEALIKNNHLEKSEILINNDDLTIKETSKTDKLLTQFIKNTIPQLSKTLKVNSFFAGKINFDFTKMDVPVSYEAELSEKFMESQVHDIEKHTNLLSYCYYKNKPIYENNFSKNYTNYVSEDAYKNYLNDCLLKRISPAESVIYIPLVLTEDKQPIGILSIQSKDKNSYTEKDFEFVHSLGRNLALALWSAQLQDEKELVLKIVGHRFRNRFSTFKKHREELYNNLDYNSLTEAKEDIIKIMLEDEKLEQTFDNLITFNSQLNPNKSAIGEFTIHEEINRTIKEVDFSAKFRQVEIIFNSELTIRDKAFMETMHFNEILTNLLVNALVAYDTLDNNDTRIRQIKVCVEKQSKDKRYKIYIEDNASGMTEKTQHLLFKSNLKKDRTGLGSLICKKLIEYYNEEIQIEKSDPNGTTISFTIPKG